MPFMGFQKVIYPTRMREPKRSKLQGVRGGLEVQAPQRRACAMRRPEATDGTCKRFAIAARPRPALSSG